MSEKLSVELDLSTVDKSLRPAVAKYLSEILEGLPKQMGKVITAEPMLVESAESEDPIPRMQKGEAGNPLLKPDAAAAHLVVHGIANRLERLAKLANTDVVVSGEADY